MKPLFLAMITALLFSNQSHGLATGSLVGLSVTSYGTSGTSYQNKEKRRKEKEEERRQEYREKEETEYIQKYQVWATSIETAKPLATALLAAGDPASPDYNSDIFLQGRLALKEMYPEHGYRIMQDNVFAAYVILSFVSGYEVPFEQIESEVPASSIYH